MTKLTFSLDVERSTERTARMTRHPLVMGNKNQINGRLVKGQETIQPPTLAQKGNPSMHLYELPNELTVYLSSVFGIEPRGNYLIIYTASGITQVDFGSDASANEKLEVKTKFITAWRTVNGDSDMPLYEFPNGTIVDLDQVIGVRPYGYYYLTLYTSSGMIYVRFNSHLPADDINKFMTAWHANQDWYGSKD